MAEEPNLPATQDAPPPEEAPKPAKSKGLATYETFETELREREQSIVSMLPNHVSRERFINSAIAAVKQTPDLLFCTPRSLFSAITKSAQDGLLPDGREGIITVYNEKQKDNSYLKVAQWNPMAWGLRKRARELDDIIVSTAVVHQNDAFTYQEGDEPRIEHKPAPLKEDRGNMIGVYAIFRRGSEILHREVMNAAQVAQIQAQSKSATGIMWTKFAGEAWRKSVLRRGFKSVPVSENLETIIHRDDESFAFDEPQVIEQKPSVLTRLPGHNGESISLTAEATMGGGNGGGSPPPFTDDEARVLSDLHNELADASTPEEIQVVVDNHTPELEAMKQAGQASERFLSQWQAEVDGRQKPRRKAKGA